MDIERDDLSQNNRHGNGQRPNEPDEFRIDAPTLAHTDKHTTGDATSSHGARTPPQRYWQTELQRWLLTLTAERTQEEYTKAVTYFFRTPGVPQDLAEISPDLLLAYRGSLALRASRREVARNSRTNFAHAAARIAYKYGQVPQLTGPDRDTTPPPHSAVEHTGPLAPATVNIRLTALRQYLLFAVHREPLNGLSPERIRATLRRLPVERRRPYQILSEGEWPDFIATALGPTSQTLNRDPSPVNISRTPVPSRPWGLTRAEREENLRTSQPQRASAPRPTQTSEGADQSIRTHDGRTGARTAQRDYALVALALATGLRAIELSLLDVGDLTRERHHGHDEWWLVLPDEKTKGQRGGRTLPIALELAHIVLNYIRDTGRAWERMEDKKTPLFLALARGRVPAGAQMSALTTHTAGSSPDRWSRRLRPEQIRGVINRIEEQWLERQRPHEENDHAGEDRRISPHALRHSAAIALLKGNEDADRPPASVEHVRGWLGHFDIRTTQRYLDHLNSRDERRRFAIKPAQPEPAAEKPETNDRPDHNRESHGDGTGNMIFADTADATGHAQPKPGQ